MKTEFLLFGNQSQLRDFDDLVGIRIKGRVIRRANSTKYLGTILDEGLKWDKHVSYISSKILRNIGVIKRVRTFLPKETLDTLRFENTDHAKLLQDLGWLDIEQLIAYDTAVMMYKVQKDSVPHETVELFEPFRFTHSYNTRSSDFEDFQLYKALSCIGQRSIAHAGTKTWNELPQYIKEAQSLDVFKDRLKEHFLF